MTDTMTNEKMRAEFEAHCKKENSAYKPTDDGVSNRRDWAIWQAATMKAAQWRPIADGLPKPWDEVLIQLSNGRATTGRFCGEALQAFDWFSSDDETGDESVLSWMPLPPTGTGGNV